MEDFKIFKSKVKVIKENDDFILDANQLFKDIEEWVENEKKEKKLEKLDRGHPLQHILNSTSGNYIAPTSMKSFNTCPGSYLYNKLIVEKTGTATSVGRTFHTIMEKWYNEEERTLEKLNQITEETIKEDEQFDKADDVRFYVKGYLDSPDYLTGKPMDHAKLICSTETFIKPIINPLGVDLGVPVYTLIDRIDIRDEGVYVIDYKTGMGDPVEYNLGENGYLPQMIFYKWAVEAEYGQEVKGVYLSLPGADSKEYKYTEMNVNSLVEQSKVLEKVKEYIDFARNVRAKKKFPIYPYMRFCNPYLKSLCNNYEEETIIDVEIKVLDHYE